MSSIMRRRVSRRRHLLPRQSVRYLLRDDFAFDLAAGSVIGTPASPGPGTRAGADTNNKISVAGGLLDFATGAAANSGISISSVTRAAGVVYCGQVTGQTGFRQFLGWGNAASGLNSYMALDARQGVGISAYIEGGALRVGDVCNASVDQRLVVVLRATGGFYFAYGGPYATWVLLYAANGGTTSTLYPAITTPITTSVATHKFLRVPRRRWSPVPVLSDGFGTAGNVSDGLGHEEGVNKTIGAGGAGRTWLGTTWANSGGNAANAPVLGAEQASGNLVVGTWYSITATQVNYFFTGCAVGNVFRATATTALDANNKVKALTLAELFRLHNAGTPDIVLIADPTLTTGTQAGVAFGWDSDTSPANGAVLYGDGGANIYLDECVAGVWTNKLTKATAWSQGGRFQVNVQGSAVRAYYGSTLVGAYTSNAACRGNLHGLFSTYSSNTFSNGVLYTSGVGGEYEVINRWTR